jgi:hypothetical protein
MTLDQVDAVLDTLRAAMGKGKASIEYDGFRTSYFSPAQIAEGIAYFERYRLGLTGSPRLTQTAAVFSRE